MDHDDDDDDDDDEVVTADMTDNIVLLRQFSCFQKMFNMKMINGKHICNSQSSLMLGLTEEETVAARQSSFHCERGESNYRRFGQLHQRQNLFCEIKAIKKSKYLVKYRQIHVIAC